MIYRDLKRGKAVSAILALFIAISAMLSSSATDLLYSFFCSMNNFFALSKTAHLLQMHSGPMAKEEIEKFVKEHEYIEKCQIVTLLNVEGDSLMIDKEGNTELGSVIDNSFVMQNGNFDFLLDEKNQVAEVSEGQAAVPMYYAVKYGLEKGDTISVRTKNGTVHFTISAFVRDSQMNSSYISSKRILLCEKDWRKLRSLTGSIEYIIEFRIDDIEKIQQLETEYLEAGLPANGPTLTYSGIRLLNSLTDVMIGALIFLVSLLLIMISILCIRFTMIASIDEDYRDIGAMKSIGIPVKFISDIYMKKYLILSIIGCFAGYILSFFMRGLIQENVKVYMGLVEKNMKNAALQLGASILVGSLVVFFCTKAVNRIQKVHVVDVLQGKNMKNSDVTVHFPSLKGRGRQGVNIRLGIKYMISYKRPYVIITFIFITLTFFVLLPLQLMTTIQSPQFISYMGVAACDVRVDLQNANTLSRESMTIKNILEKDKDVKLFEIYNTYLAISQDKEGEDVSLNFETGDFRKFPISCIEGRSPEREGELAISYLASTQLNKKLGDEIVIKVDETSYPFTICGIYQDITNGGKSTKTMVYPEGIPPSRGTINIHFVEGTNILEKVNMYGKSFPGGKITDIQDYVAQSMGDFILQLREITILTMLIAMLIIVFTVTVFMKLLIIRNKEDIGVMKGLGFQEFDIRFQYGVRIFISLATGIVIGAFLVKIGGQPLVGKVTASMGAAKIVFITNIFYAYILCPFCMLLAAFVTILLASKDLKRINMLQGM